MASRSTPFSYNNQPQRDKGRCPGVAQTAVRPAWQRRDVAARRGRAQAQPCAVQPPLAHRASSPILTAALGTSRGLKQPATCCFQRLPPASLRFSTRPILKCLREIKCAGFPPPPSPPLAMSMRRAQVHRWLDKSFLVSLAARACGFTLLFRKVVPFSRTFGSKSVKFGRPSYSHVLCFARDGTCSVSKGAWADVSARGSLVYAPPLHQSRALRCVCVTRA